METSAKNLFQSSESGQRSTLPVALHGDGYEILHVLGHQGLLLNLVRETEILKHTILFQPFPKEIYDYPNRKWVSMHTCSSQVTDLGKGHHEG